MTYGACRNQGREEGWGWQRGSCTFRRASHPKSPRTRSRPWGSRGGWGRFQKTLLIVVEMKRSLKKKSVGWFCRRMKKMLLLEGYRPKALAFYTYWGHPMENRRVGSSALMGFSHAETLDQGRPLPQRRPSCSANDLRLWPPRDPGGKCWMQ